MRLLGIDCKNYVKHNFCLELNQSIITLKIILSCGAVFHRTVMKCRTFREFELGYADHSYTREKIIKIFFSPRFSSCCSSKGKPSFRNVEDSARQGILHFARI